MAKIFCSGKTKQRDSRSVTGQLERGKQAFVCLDDIFPTKQPPNRYRARAQRMERFRKTLCARSVFSSARESKATQPVMCRRWIWRRVQANKRREQPHKKFGAAYSVDRHIRPTLTK